VRAGVPTSSGSAHARHLISLCVCIQLLTSDGELRCVAADAERKADHRQWLDRRIGKMVAQLHPFVRRESCGTSAPEIRRTGKDILFVVGTHQHGATIGRHTEGTVHTGHAGRKGSTGTHLL
jgi:hypothetical protein